MTYHRLHINYKNGKNPGKKTRPIIHWRNPIRGLFYYPKGMRRKKLMPKEQTWKPRVPLGENAIFKPSSVVRQGSKTFSRASEVIPKGSGEFINRSLF